MSAGFGRGTAAALALLAIQLASPGPAAAACQNEALRGGASSRLHDCRAYELASPGLGPVSLRLAIGVSLPDGSAVAFRTLGAPAGVEASGLYNVVVSRREPAGWDPEPLTTPLSEPVSIFNAYDVQSVSGDLSRFLARDDQPLAGESSPSGPNNLYLRRADGSYASLTTAGSTSQPEVDWTTPDLSNVFFRACGPQLPVDPVSACPGNTYQWSENGLRLIGVLPGGALAPNGGYLAHSSLPPVSDDGREVLFVAPGPGGDPPGPLYLRLDGQQTVDVSASQRTVEPDPKPYPAPVAVGLAADGSEALFISSAELTNDAYTGRSGGVATDAGADLYSYDVADGLLTDLTVGRDDADAATGADVVSVLGAAADLSFVYFIARGNLAEGAVSGAENLYVEHDGTIELVAADVEPEGFYVTPDGRHAAVLSRRSLTGYDNVNPQSDESEPQLFVYSYPSGLECASCRPDGTPPTGGATLAPSGFFAGRSPLSRTLTDDGSRAFFQSTDAIVPDASNGLQNVFEYTQGTVRLISPGDGLYPASLLDASADGSDVFFVSRDQIVPHGLEGISEVYDARIGGGLPPISIPPRCAGEGCLEPARPAPGLDMPASGTRADRRLSAPRRLTIRGGRGRLRIVVPGPGAVSIAGRGLLPVAKRVYAAGPTVVPLRLTPSGESARRERTFATSAAILFHASTRTASRVRIGLRFISGRAKGRLR